MKTQTQKLSTLVARNHDDDSDHFHEALPESDRHFRQMIDALPAAIYTTDAQGRLTHFNPAAVEFSGMLVDLMCHLANSTQRVSRKTVTRIWPGYCNCSSIILEISRARP